MADQAVFKQFILSGVHITENELGRGSYAVVLELKYQGLKCAGKKLYRFLSNAKINHAAKRYLEECQLLSQTKHPNIVQFLGVCFEEGSQFPILVMEFLPTNLSSCLDCYGILPNESSYSILHDVSLGLAYLHGQAPPIIHRDLSANNVLLSTNMTAKISDLGVARILNYTPLQVSRMTETPGTPAYMPPEVMVADPHYDTSVDVFSFGVMMIHTFTAEWPLPKVGPNRVDPANPDKLISVTEAERREEFLRKISQDHPLTDLINNCLKNNPKQRPQAEEIVSRTGDVVLQFPPSFENRVEMLKHICAVSTKQKQLEQDLLKKELALIAKEKQVKSLIEERAQIKKDFENTENFETEQSIRIQLEVEELKNHLKMKEATNNCLKEQLAKAKNFLARKPQSMQMQLAYGRCSEAPMKMTDGRAISIKGKVYYGGGDCDSSDDKFFIHSLSQRVWTVLPKLSVCYFGLGRVRDQLVTVGGITDTQKITNEIHVYDEASQTWQQTIPPMPTARETSAVVSLAAHLVVAGGCLPGDKPTDIVEIYHTDTRQWSSADKLPHASDDLKATVCNNVVYVMGGWDGEKRFSEVFTAEIDKLISGNQQGSEEASTTDSNHIWKQTANTPSYHPSAVALCDTVLAVGGIKSAKTDEYETAKEIYAYSSSMDSWVFISDLAPLIACPTTVSLSSTELLVIGCTHDSRPTRCSVYTISLRVALL